MAAVTVVDHWIEDGWEYYTLAVLLEPGAEEITREEAEKIGNQMAVFCEQGWSRADQALNVYRRRAACSN